MARRKLFDELMEGVDAMKAHHEGKITLRSYTHEPEPLPEIDPAFIRETRERLRCSRAVFARKLRINERTLEKWEQGRGKPNRRPLRCFCWCGAIPILFGGWTACRGAELSASGGI